MRQMVAAIRQAYAALEAPAALTVQDVSTESYLLLPGSL